MLFQGLATLIRSLSRLCRRHPAHVPGAVKRRQSKTASMPGPGATPELEASSVKGSVKGHACRHRAAPLEMSRIGAAHATSNASLGRIPSAGCHARRFNPPCYRTRNLLLRGHFLADWMLHALFWVSCRCQVQPDTVAQVYLFRAYPYTTIKGKKKKKTRQRK